MYLCVRARACPCVRVGAGVCVWVGAHGRVRVGGLVHTCCQINAATCAAAAAAVLPGGWSVACMQVLAGRLASNDAGAVAAAAAPSGGWFVACVGTAAELARVDGAAAAAAAALTWLDGACTAAGLAGARGSQKSLSLLFPRIQASKNIQS